MKFPVKLIAASSLFIAKLAFAQTAPIILLTGQYSLTNDPCFNPFYPLTIASFDNAQSWKAIIPNLNLPNGLTFSSISNAVCNTNGCLAVGIDSGKITTHPLILQSDATASNWTINNNIQGLPPFISGGYLSSLHCQGNECLAQGTYTTGINILGNKPFVITSDDAGKNWKFNSLPLVKFFNYQTTAFACGTGFCTLLGNNYDSTQKAYLPLIYTNGNSDHSWSMTQTVANLPGSFTDYTYDLTAMNCSGNVCAAVGSYYPNGRGQIKPLLIVSYDQAKSWQFIDISTNNIKNVVLRQISSTDDNFVAVGTSLHHTVIVESHDLGRTWALTEKLPLTNTYWPMVNCNGSTCIVAGAFTNKQLYVLLSKDAGNTWTLNENFGISVNGQINSISCNTNSCIMVGNDNSSNPLLISSQDGGVTWMQQNNIANLPNQMTFMFLSSISNEYQQATLNNLNDLTHMKKMGCYK